MATSSWSWSTVVAMKSSRERLKFKVMEFERYKVRTEDGEAQARRTARRTACRLPNWCSITSQPGTRRTACGGLGMPVSAIILALMAIPAVLRQSAGRAFGQHADRHPDLCDLQQHDLGQPGMGGAGQAVVLGRRLGGACADARFLCCCCSTSGSSCSMPWRAEACV
jgi:hypothetical protein